MTTTPRPIDPDELLLQLAITEHAADWTERAGLERAQEVVRHLAGITTGGLATLTG